LPGLAALELCELAALLADLARDVEQDAAALDRPAVTPAGERSPRRRDRGGDVGGVAARHLGDLLARRGVVVGQIAGALRRHPVPVDEVIPALLRRRDSYEAVRVTMAAAANDAGA